MEELLNGIGLGLTAVMAIFFTALTGLTAWEMKENLWNGMRERLLAGFATLLFFAMAIYCISGLVNLVR